MASITVIPFHKLSIVVGHLVFMKTRLTDHEKLFNRKNKSTNQNFVATNFVFQFHTLSQFD
jgi:hypothetical protein